jgi:hypothetical protein
MMLAAFFTAVNSTWVIDFLDALAVLVMSALLVASRALIEGVRTRPERVVVPGSPSIASAMRRCAARIPYW